MFVKIECTYTQKLGDDANDNAVPRGQLAKFVLGWISVLTNILGERVSDVFDAQHNTQGFLVATQKLEPSTKQAKSRQIPHKHVRKTIEIHIKI